MEQSYQQKRSKQQQCEALAGLTWKRRKYGTSQGYSARYHWKRSRGGEWSPGDIERDGEYDGVHHNRSSGQGAKVKDSDKQSRRSSSRQHMQFQHLHRKEPCKETEEANQRDKGRRTKRSKRKRMQIAHHKKEEKDKGPRKEREMDHQKAKARRS